MYWICYMLLIRFVYVKLLTLYNFNLLKAKFVEIQTSFSKSNSLFYPNRL